MTEQDLTVDVRVDASPEAVLDAILDVRSWWTGEIDGDTAHLGGRFEYRYGALHRSTQRITELTADRVVWHVEDGRLAFTSTGDDWVGTDIVFALRPEESGTRLVFVHRGIGPEDECYDRCSPAWGHYIGTNLRSRILSGRPALEPA